MSFMYTSYFVSCRVLEIEAQGSRLNFNVLSGMLLNAMFPESALQ